VSAPGAGRSGGAPAPPRRAGSPGPAPAVRRRAGGVRQRDVRQDLAALEEVEVRDAEQWYLLRTALQGVAAKVLQAVGVAVPPPVRPLPVVPTPTPPSLCPDSQPL
jgi:hypothetical protein